MATNPLPQPSFPVDLLPPRAALASAIETLLAIMDAMDGDPDQETTGLEDDFIEHHYANGPGCPLADGQSGCDSLPGDRDDAEAEEDKGIDDDPHDQEHEDQEVLQMPGDVPCPLVFANEKDRDGKREFLGINNMTAAFVGIDILDAATGRRQTGRPYLASRATGARRRPEA